MTLLLIAKPGDELLYFAPTLLNNENLLVLSLTTGSWDGDDWSDVLAEKHKRQFQESQRVFNRRYFIVDNPRVRFCPHVSFDVDRALSIVCAFVRYHEIRRVFTYNGRNYYLELTRRNVGCLGERIPGVQVYWLNNAWGAKTARKFGILSRLSRHARQYYDVIYGKRADAVRFLAFRTTNKYQIANI